MTGSWFLNKLKLAVKTRDKHRAELRILATSLDVSLPALSTKVDGWLRDELAFLSRKEEDPESERSRTEVDYAKWIAAIVGRKCELSAALAYKRQ